MLLVFQLRSAAELENIPGMDSLTTLVLENNPFSQHNHDFVSYASKMRKLFPNLQLLVRNDRTTLMSAFSLSLSLFLYMYM